jgi:hypothetical protein
MKNGASHYQKSFKNPAEIFSMKLRKTRTVSFISKANFLN